MICYLSADLYAPKLTKHTDSGTFWSASIETLSKIFGWSGSKDRILTVLSAKPATMNFERRRPSGTSQMSMHFISTEKNSVWISFSKPVFWSSSK